MLQSKFIEGDMFKIIALLNDEYSYDFVADKQEKQKVPIAMQKCR